MGLDMDLTGNRYFMKPRVRGDLKSEQYDLGYWRKHPNLHGYIVREFADGVDECQRIELAGGQIRQVIAAIKDRELPRTTGFFFGESEDSAEQIAYDLHVFEEALAWLEDDNPEVLRWVSYQASW